MKQYLLSAFAMASVMFSYAQEKPTEPVMPTPPVPTFTQMATDGNTVQYLYNKDANAFMLGANDWNTRASVKIDKGYKFKVKQNENNYFVLNDSVETQSAWKAVFAENAGSIWVDNLGGANVDKWVITASEEDATTYYITNPSADANGKLGVEPAKNDTRLYLTSAADGQVRWGFVTPEDYEKYLEDFAAYKPAYDNYLSEMETYKTALEEWQKENYVAGDDVTFLATAWTSPNGNVGNYSGIENAKEIYSATGSQPAGDVLVQNLTNLKAGTYELTFVAAGSFTSGRGFECPTGDDLAVAFVGDKEVNLPIVDRTWVGADGAIEIKETVTVTDGTLNFGIKNNADAGNWYVAAVKSFVYLSAPEPKQLTAGDYFIINAESGKFLNGNNAWGTKASVTETAQLMTIAVLEDGTYTIDSHISNGGANHFVNAGENLFVDGAASAQTIAEISDGIFSIKDVNGKFLAADAEGIVNFNAEDATSAAAQWKIVTKDELLATFENASEENPVNANFLISDANFGRNNTYNSAWQGDKPAFGGVNYSKSEFTPAGQIAEVWGGNVKKATDYYQEIEVPNGIYTLTVQGFYRYNNTDENTNDVAQTAHADGTEVIYSKLYANSDTVSLKSLFDDEVVAAAEADETVKVPFNLTEAGNAFAKGFYVNTVKVAVKTGVLKFGVTKTEHIGTDWTVWDNFRLTYIGKLDEPVPAIDEAIAKLDLALKAANEKLASYAAGDALFQYSEAELAPLSNAIAAANAAKVAEDATEESVNNARTALNEAVEAFAPKANAPKEGQAYILTLTTAENNQLSVSADGIKVEAEGTPVYFVAQENGYAISNGTEYVNYEGSNNWTMTASAEAYGWTIALADGGYSITGKNGLLGTNANETAAGSPCYGDKKTTNGNYIWTITEYVAPEQPDAIESVETEAATSVKKVVVDGKVVIVKGGKTFNVAGALLK